MANTVIALKKSGTSSAVPSSLANGEIAINYADGVIFYKHANGTIASFSGGGGSTISFGTVNASGTLLLADVVNDVLDVRAGQNIIITGDAINDRMTINADLTAANSWANSVSAASNAWANTLTTTDRAIANAAANSANAYTVTVGASANNWANNKLANTSGVSFAGDLYFPTGNIGVGSGSSAGYRLYVNGSFAANTKSFVIDHPTKPDMKLRHGSLEGPENGVYVRGRVQGKVIELPDYWIGLVDEETITVQLTAIGHSQNPYVVEVSNNKVFIDTENHTQPYCYFTVYGERKDVEKLVVEY